MRRGVLGLTFFALVLAVLAPPVRAGREARVGVDTADPSASTAVPTNVQVFLGAADYQPPEPSGNVTVSDNGKTIGTAVPGMCRDTPCRTFKYTFEAGPHSLVAHYAGDSNYDAVDSDPDSFTLSPYGVVTKIDTADRTVSEGESVTFHASVKGDRNDMATLQPTGTVTLEDENYDCKRQTKALATVALDGNQEASFTTASLPPCNIHVVSALYNGDRNYHDYGTYDGFTNVKVNARSADVSSDTVTTRRGAPTSTTARLTLKPAYATTTTPAGGVVVGGVTSSATTSSASHALGVQRVSHDSSRGAVPVVLAAVMVTALAAGAWRIRSRAAP